MHGLMGLVSDLWVVGPQGFYAQISADIFERPLRMGLRARAHRKAEV